MPRWLHGIHEQRMFMECSTCLWIHLKLERFHLYRSIKRHRFYEWLWSSYLSRRVRTRYSKSKTFDWTVQYTKNKSPRRSSPELRKDPLWRILSEGSSLKDPPFTNEYPHVTQLRVKMCNIMMHVLYPPASYFMNANEAERNGLHLAAIAAIYNLRRTFRSMRLNWQTYTAPFSSRDFLFYSCLGSSDIYRR